MAKDSKIAWTDHTFNVAWGCKETSAGCQNCYAREQMNRWGFGWAWGDAEHRRLFGEKHWREPLAWNKKAEQEGVPAKVFCSSMCDVFDPHPDVRGELPKLWELIRRTPWLIWQLCTKQSGQIAACLPADWGENGYHNVWLGVTVENLGEGNAVRALTLRRIPAVVRWISNEPALSNISAMPLAGIDWVVYGGESGPNARPDDDLWARNLLGRCVTTGTAFFYKQMSARVPGVLPLDTVSTIREFPIPRLGFYPPESFTGGPSIPRYSTVGAVVRHFTDARLPE